MIIITEWFGRLGNNIIQIINAIYYAIEHNHNIIQFPEHNMLLNNTIIINENAIDVNSVVSDTFFYILKYNIKRQEPYEMKEIFNKYIRYIFKIIDTSISDIQYNNTDNLYIHIRGGDIFNSNPHSYYVQPPLYYYKEIIKTYKHIYIITEDKLNPCINELIKLENVTLLDYDMNQQLNIVKQSQNLAIGFSTFGFLLYLLSPSLKNIYVPDYSINYCKLENWGENFYPHGSWGNTLCNIINLPNYIKVNEWYNTSEQQNLMINYMLS